MTLELDLSYAARQPWVPRRGQFMRWAAAALAGRTRPGRSRPGRPRAGPRSTTVLSIRVVGAARSRSLNARFRHKDRPTNVLSFGGAGVIPDGRRHLGELVICAPVVAAEARAAGKPPESHWAHLTVHGVLHLLGFDHERRDEARSMAAVEIQILERLGISDPYA